MRNNYISQTFLKHDPDTVIYEDGDTFAYTCIEYGIPLQEWMIPTDKTKCL